jgi:hypothetical protein
LTAVALVILHVCSDVSVVVFINIVVVSVVVVVGRWEKGSASGHKISTGLGYGEGQYRAATEKR